MNAVIIINFRERKKLKLLILTYRSFLILKLQFQTLYIFHYYTFRIWQTNLGVTDSIVTVHSQELVQQTLPINFSHFHQTFFSLLLSESFQTLNILKRDKC